MANILTKKWTLLLTAFTFIALPVISGCSRETNTSYVLHGKKIEDKYLWMEDSKSSRLQTWVQTQNLTARKVLNDLPEKKWLQQQMIQNRYQEGVRYEPLHGKRVFYWRKKVGESYKVFCTRANATASEEVLINPNEWRNNHYVDVEYCAPSPDGNYVAYCETIGGSLDGEIKIIDVKSKRILPERLMGPWQSFCDWDGDSLGFYYCATSHYKDDLTTGDENYWLSVFHHRLGTPVSDDEKIFFNDEHKDYWHSAQLSEDKKYLILFRGSGYFNTEVYFRKIGKKGETQPVVTGMEASYRVYIYDNKIFIQTNYNAPNGQVFVTNINQPQKKYWKKFLPEKQEALQNIVFANHYIYANYLKNAHTQLKVYDLNGNFINDIPLPGLGTAYVGGYWAKGPVYIEYKSFIQPKTTYSYDLINNKLNLIKENAYQHFYDISDLKVEQIWYQSKDETPISMFLIGRKNLIKNDDQPVILEGYGGFKESIIPDFNVYYYHVVKKGVVVALPNLRGGGEYGEKWHQAGMKEKKQNTIDDYISAAEWLIANHYTNPDRLAAFGGSNGGLTVAAAMVQRPDLFKTVVCQSALLDMMRYHKFNYAEIWGNEYGTSEKKEQFDYLIRYSPYYNVRDNKKYPDILFTVGQNDSVVAPLHSFKMAAKMQEGKKSNVVLLAQYGNFGHLGGDRNEKNNLVDDTYAFILNKLNVELK